VDGVKVIFMLLSQTGQLGKELASQYMESVLGWRVIARCARFRVGEIDIVATGGEPVLHFIEVKFRNTSTFGDVSESITYQKVQRLKRAISEWRREKGDYRSGEMVFIGIQRAGPDGGSCGCARAQGQSCDSFGDGFEVRVERIE
jgi:putative endonuclease